MPGINGWEFLEAYDELEEKQHGRIVIVMLTTSLNPDDEKKANSIPPINGFQNKPLTPESLQEILKEHFRTDYTS